MKRVLFVLTWGILGFAGAQALAEDGAPDGAALFADSCARCHGDDGSGTPGGITPLHEQTSAAIIEKLDGYKAGAYGGSHKATMEGVAQGLSADKIAAVAGYIGKN